MAHFAKVLNGVVINVIVAEQEFIDNFVDSSPGEWIQTSYNTRGGVHYKPAGEGEPYQSIPDGGVALRANYAGIGYTYDAINDVFYAPRPVDVNGNPCNSWTIGAPTWLWTPPTPMPEGNLYHWNETTQSWE